MALERTRWSDERLDDRLDSLAKLVSALDTKVDDNTDLVRSHDRDLRELSQRGDRRRDTNRTVILMLATVLATELAQVILRLAGAA